MNVTARTIPLSAVQNHSEPGPMNDIPSVLMNVTPAPSVLLPRWADDTLRGARGVGLFVPTCDGRVAVQGKGLRANAYLREAPKASPSIRALDPWGMPATA